MAFMVIAAEPLVKSDPQMLRQGNGTSLGRTLIAVCFAIVTIYDLSMATNRAQLEAWELAFMYFSGLSLVLLVACQRMFLDAPKSWSIWGVRGSLSLLPVLLATTLVWRFAVV
jgi:uncharacterized membrane protein